MRRTGVLFLLPIVLNCSTSQHEDTDVDEVVAVVVSVEVTGEENNYTFKVGLSSPDTGCDQYANWWEVITPDGKLLYRRILTHSHVDEQPFVRSGGPVSISQDETVIVRGYMHTAGYGQGEIAMKGLVSTGFNPYDVAPDLFIGLAEQEPLPDGCRF